jgi:hypothetical protein
MKKIYVRPTTDAVNVKLFGSVLDFDTPVGGYSLRGKPEDSFGKENSDIVFDDNFGDLWDNPDAGSNAYDLWGE